VPDFRDIVWCFSVDSAIPREQLASAGRRIIYHRSIPDFKSANNGPRLVVLDDLLNEAYSSEMCDLFTKGSHHRDISVILITQNLFHQGRFSRDISLNTNYLVVLKNVREKNQFAYLARQVCTEDSKRLYKSYLDATRSPHGYLLLDLAKHKDDRLRFRTLIFPSEVTAVYAPIGYEKDTVELSPLTSAQVRIDTNAKGRPREFEKGRPHRTR